MGALFKLISAIAAGAWPILRIIFSVVFIFILVRYTQRDQSLAARVDKAEARSIRSERAAQQYYTLGESNYSKLYRLMKTKRYRRLLKLCSVPNDTP